MCVENTLQQHILNITNGGKTVADFFHATMQGQTHNAQVNHRMDAAKQLAKLGLTTCDITARPEPVQGHDNHELITDNRELKTESHPVTDFDIINYEAARLIREETNDGYHIADFLTRVMRGSSESELTYSRKDRVISPADRMAAAKELLNRGFGKFGDARSRRISNSRNNGDLIGSGLARYMREGAEQGIETARFLLDVASGQDDRFSVRQRVAATRELLRRGWDINYDAVTPEHIVAYYERQDALKPTEYDIRLQEWREQERVKQEAQRERREDESLPEPGIFAHLTFAEIDRYEAMSAQEQAEFIQQQRDRSATRQSPPTEADQPETTDKPSHDSENIDWNALLQEITAPSRASYPTHPVKSRASIRSP